MCVCARACARESKCACVYVCMYEWRQLCMCCCDCICWGALRGCERPSTCLCILRIMSAWGIVIHADLWVLDVVKAKQHINPIVFFKTKIHAFSDIHFKTLTPYFMSLNGTENFCARKCVVNCKFWSIRSMSLLPRKDVWKKPCNQSAGYNFIPSNASSHNLCASASYRSSNILGPWPNI